MHDQRVMLNPRKSYMERVKDMAELHSEGHQLTVQNSVISEGNLLMSQDNS
jgi:hypothetical protein